MATNTELTARYNELATTLGKPTIAPWKGKKEVIEARIAEMEAQTKPKKAPRRERKTPVEKVDNELQGFLEGALKNGATPSEAIRQMMEAFPKATRILVKHSAKAAGINPLTARNLFDRIRRTK
ncbi:DNA packaging protein fI [Caudoviricetes sp.]|nr:DNA packaging protein fI [Caudoviricetes sp.]